MIGLFVLFYNSVSEELSKIEKVSFEPLQNFKIEEKDESKIISNQNLGFLAKIPKNWEFQLDQTNKSIIFYSSEDSNLENQTFQKDCLITLRVEYREVEKIFSVLKNTIAQLKEKPQIGENLELVEIDGRNAVKETVEVKGVGKVIRVSFPEKEKVFMFGALLFPKKEKECQRYFEEFLNSIELKK